MDSYNKLKAENDDEFALITSADRLITQFDDINSKIGNAIHGLTVLSSMFSDQAIAYGAIRTGLTDVNETLSEHDDPENRKIFIQILVEELGQKLTELEVAAKGFTEAILSEDSSVFSSDLKDK